MEESQNIKKLKMFLGKLIELDGSDLHLKSNSNIRARVQGEIVPLTKDVLKKELAFAWAKEIFGERYKDFETKKEIDFVFKYDDNYRFRGNAFFQLDGISFVFRKIPTKILSLKDLNMPDAMYKISKLERGLILVTGVTGSGKSTTMASIINEINETEKKHIITIEDPIEFIHPDKQSLINQRGVGDDTLNFKNALRAALREDPDVILVGEMRDLETIEIALHASETGHLVFGTLHTTDTKETINRIISMFPPDEQNRIRVALASSIGAIISQRLVKTVDKKRAAALEILLKTPRVEALIKENRDSEILDALAEGKEIHKTQTFDQALFDLVEEGRITIEEALRNATKPTDLKLKLSMRANKKESSGESEEKDFIELKR